MDGNRRHRLRAHGAEVPARDWLRTLPENPAGVPPSPAWRAAARCSPISRSCGVAFSISLWLIPSSQGTKIMPVGATVQTWQASCPAPETMSPVVVPQAGRGPPDRPDAPGIEPDRRLVPDSARRPRPTPDRCAMPANESRISASIAVRASASGWRTSTEKAHFSRDRVPGIRGSRRADRRCRPRAGPFRARSPPTVPPSAPRRRQRVLPGRHRRRPRRANPAREPPRRTSAGLGRRRPLRWEPLPARGSDPARYGPRTGRRGDARRRARRPCSRLRASIVSEGIAFGAAEPPGEVPVEQPREHPRGDHRRGEARAFLVGPVDDLDGRFRLDPGVVEGAPPPPARPARRRSRRTCRRGAACRDGSRPPPAADPGCAPGAGRTCCPSRPR